MADRTILFLVDGFGVSSKWQGNIFASDNMPNFQNLTKQFPYRLLKPLSPSVNCGFEEIFFGKELTTYRELIDRQIQSKDFFRNDEIKKIFERTKIHSANLHLFFTLSKNINTSSISHLFGILKMALQNGVPLTFLHLAVDSSIEDISMLLEKIALIDEYILQINYGEIATVVGTNTLFKEDVAKIIQSIANKKRLHSISYSHAFKPLEKKKIADLPTVSFSSTASIHEFDLIFFADLDCHFFEKIIDEFVRLRKFSNSRIALKYLTIVSLSPVGNDEVDVIYKKKAVEKNDSPLLRKYKDNILVISELAEIKRLEKIVGHRFDACVMPKMQRHTKQFFEKYLSRLKDKLIDDLKKRKQGLTIVELPVFSQISELSFKVAVEYAQSLDGFIAFLSDAYKKYQSEIMITSPYAFAEDYLMKSIEMKENPVVVPTGNHIPYLKISTSGDAVVSRLSTPLLQMVEKNDNLGAVCRDLVGG